MLSKKMAFSLMGLITIFALAFVVPSAMAAEFTVSLGVGSETDVSHADGDQIEIVDNQNDPTITAIMVTFGAVVDSNPLAIGAPTDNYGGLIKSQVTLILVPTISRSLHTTNSEEPSLMA